MPKIRVGFICGKDTDFVEHPGWGPKYAKIGDLSFLADVPDKWRVDAESHEYLMDCEPGTKGQVHCDIALAWYIHKTFKDIVVDVITPDVLDLKRLNSNDLNFTLGYNAVNIKVENNESGPKKMQAFRKAVNIFPTWESEEFILYKTRYMQACMDAGVPMAPTIFAFRGKRSPASLLKQIKARGWKTFVMKQSESGFCLGFLKLTVEKVEGEPKILDDYFKKYAHCPEFIVQEAIEGFTRNWETRCFWYNGEFLYAIANMAAVSTEDGAERIITGDDIPAEFLENAKKIGQEAIKALPELKVPTGQSVPMILVRTDIGCSDSALHDKNTNWDPNGKTFFLNEIEPSSTTYFTRHLKFDCLPLYGRLYAETALAAYAEMQKGPVKKERKPRVTTAMKAKAKAKKTAKAKVKVAKKPRAPAGKTAMKAAKAATALKSMKAVKLQAMKGKRIGGA